MRFVYVLLGLVTMTSIHVSSGHCSNGVDGLQSFNACCEDQCGTCGGPGCQRRPGGVASCCIQSIRATGALCSTTEAAPCVIDGLCTNGVPGVEATDIACCEAQCGTCGGPGCQLRPGGAAACCIQVIRASGIQCTTSSEAPCLIEE